MMQVISLSYYLDSNLKQPYSTAQDKYKDAKFVILDGNPHSGDFNPVVKDNTVAIFFAEHESRLLWQV